MPAPTITKRRVRCAVAVNAPFATTPLLDVYTAQNIETVQGNSTRFEFTFFTQAGEIYDLSAVQSINLKIQPSQTEEGPLADQTLAAAALDLTVDLETWADGSRAHAVFAFTNAEMNLPMVLARRPLWLVLTAILADGDGSEVTLGGGTLVLHLDNNAAAGAPPENPGTAITLEQADARYAPLSLAAALTYAGADPNGGVFYDDGTNVSPRMIPTSLGLEYESNGTIFSSDGGTFPSVGTWWGLNKTFTGPDYVWQLFKTTDSVTDFSDSSEDSNIPLPEDADWGIGVTVTREEPAIAAFLGQLCKASTAWWRWDGVKWVPTRLLTGEPILGTPGDYHKITLSGSPLALGFESISF